MGDKLNKIIKEAILTNDIETVSISLPQVSSAYADEWLELACAGSDFIIVMLIYKRFYSPTRKHFFPTINVFRTINVFGSGKIFDFILKKKELTDKDMCKYIPRVLCDAVEKNNLNLTKHLINHYINFVDNAALKVIMLRTIKNGSSEVLKFILSCDKFPRDFFDSGGYFYLHRTEREIDDKIKRVIALSPKIIGFDLPFFYQYRVVLEYSKNPSKVRRQLVKEMGFATPEAEIFAIVIFLCDDFLDLKN